MSSRGTAADLVAMASTEASAYGDTPHQPKVYHFAQDRLAGFTLIADGFELSLPAVHGTLRIFLTGIASAASCPVVSS